MAHHLKSVPQVPQKASKTALLLGGGGLTGGVFEVGTLKAIGDFLKKRSINDFDIFVGTSAGSLIAASLAFGFTSDDFFKALHNESEALPALKKRDFYHLNTKEILYNYFTFPVGLAKIIHQKVKTKNYSILNFTADVISKLLPQGFFTTAGLRDFLLKNVIKDPALDDFNQLAKELYITSCNIDTGERVVFGEDGFRHISISKAVEASSAFPFLYKPVRYKGNDYVDGGVKRTLHMDIAIAHGAKLLICINPIAPFNNTRRSADKKYISQTGIVNIVDQAFRAVIHSRASLGIEIVKKENPDLDIIVFEPKLDDLTMFSYHMMRYDARHRVADYSYKIAARQIHNHFQKYKAIFEKHGFEIDNEFMSKNYEQSDPAKGSFLSIL